MLRLDSNYLYLVVTRSSDRNSHTVGAFTTFREALASWRGGSRVSPIFPVNGSHFPASDDFWLTFTGPVHPGQLQLDGVPTFLTYGLYNVVIAAEADDQISRISDEIQRLGLPFERWRIVSGELTDPIEIETGSDMHAAVRALRFAHPAVAESSREYGLLMSTALGRAAEALPAVSAHLRQFDRAFRRALSAHSAAPVVQQGMLVRTNAALSRFTSQTFAGISPILETECHFWTHSLFGAGTPSLALLRLREFVDEILGPKTRLIDRLEQLATIESEVDIASMSDSDPFFNSDFLFGHTPACSPADRCRYAHQEQLLSAGSKERRDYLPPVSCFSGRDGFRSTDVSISAPLEILTSSNAVAWTLRTITHEISHTYVADALSVLAPTNETGMAELYQMFVTKGRARTLLHALQKFIAGGFWWSAHPDSRTRVPEDAFGRAVRSQWVEAQEIITDTFDFLYFYGGDAEAYVRSVWLSWGMIPNIEHRVEQYVTRTLCALLGANLRSSKRIEDVLSQFGGLLVKLQTRFPDALYIPNALEELKARPKHYRDRVDVRAPFVIATRYFLYSPSIRQQLIAEAGLPGRRRSAGYPERPLVFGDDIVENPLRFLGAFSNDDKPSVTRSFWLLQQLAYGAKP